jgi:hypothetical protein
MTITLWLLVVSCGMADVDRGEMFIRVGDLDGIGFMTGTAPGNGELGWPFNSWNTSLDGSCSGNQLINADGDPINVDGVDILRSGDFLPDLDCTGSQGTWAYQGCCAGSDEFDNRSNDDWGDWLVEAYGFQNIASGGSQYTDVTIGPHGNAWYFNVCPDGGTTTSICGVNPTFHFDFQVLKTDIDEGQPLYVNFVIGDYDVHPGEVRYHDRYGKTHLANLSTLNNGSAEDGEIQAVTAELPWSVAMVDAGSNFYHGLVDVEVHLPLEPFIALDYAEIGTAPLVVPVGCCAYVIFNTPGVIQFTSSQCEEVNGTFYGVGSNCVDEGVAGACCYYDVFWAVTCDIMTEEHCDLKGPYAIFHDNTSCENVSCDLSSPRGACCVSPVGACYDGTTYQQCQAYAGAGDFVQWYQGQSCQMIQCNPGPPPGACCYLDGNGAYLCTQVSLPDCMALQSSTFHGAGVPCSGLTCTPPVGGCCIEGVCVLVTRAECDAQGNQFFGEGQPCNLQECFSCEGDDDGDGVVSIEDLLRVIGNWGTCGG